MYEICDKTNSLAVMALAESELLETQAVRPTLRIRIFVDFKRWRAAQKQLLGRLLCPCTTSDAPK